MLSVSTPDNLVPIELPETSSEETIASALDIFTAGVQGFSWYGKKKPTSKTFVALYQEKFKGPVVVFVLSDDPTEFVPWRENQVVVFFRRYLKEFDTSIVKAFFVVSEDLGDLRSVCVDFKEEGLRATIASIWVPS